MILQFLERYRPKIKSRIAENIEALEKAKRNEKMITKIKVKKRNLFCLYLECINNHIAKEEKSNRDAENSSGSAKNEAYLGLAP